MWHLIFIFLSIRLVAAPIDDLTPSVPEEIASLRTDFLIGGWVNAFSGQIACTENDLYIHAAQDLLLQRTYLSPHVLGRYEDKEARDQYELANALTYSTFKGWIVLSHLWCGINVKSSCFFQVPDPSGCVLQFKLNGREGTLVTSTIGMSNLTSEGPSSEADLRNTKLFVDETFAHVQTPQGIERVYRRIAGWAYRLEQEILSNGKVIRYEYQNNGLSKISSCDPSGQFVYATIDVHEMKRFIGSDGSRTDYNYEPRPMIHGHKGKVHFGYTPFVLTHVSTPFYHPTMGYNDRTLLSSYDSHECPITCQYSAIKDRLSQVTKLSFPMGTISISYDPPRANVKGGWTSATDENGLTTVYRFNEKLLLIAIENHHNGTLVNQKRFTYDECQHVRTIETSDGQGNILLAKHYECDEEGNPLLEQWKGDFSTFSIHKRFDHNRLIEETRDDGLSTQWTYLGSTCLVTSKTVFDHDIQLRKTIFRYDDACNLIQEQEEGRTVTDYHLRQQAPYLHRIDWKVEKDWMNRLIRKTHYEYDQWGHICAEAVYGSDDVLAYTISRTFNAKGELLCETNPLGFDATYAYDDRGRCVHETTFSSLPINRTFDAKGRLIQLNEGDHFTKFIYDSTDLLIEKVDYLGQSITYSYDPVHRKPTLITSLPLEKKIVYDAFGRPILTQDGEDNPMHTTFNSYSSPLQIIHPGGGKELFEYAPNGNRIRQIDADGIATTFTYDVLKRTLSKTTSSATTLYRYDGYDCIEEMNAEGISTHYLFNLASQKIQEETAGRVTTFGYDPLGFLNSIEKSGRITTIQNDLLGRPLERNVSGRLKTIYTYDSAGNTTSITRRGTTHFHYDPYSRLIEKTDPLGHSTVMTYVEGDRSLIKKIKDPRGVVTVEYFDPHDCLLKKEVDRILTQEFAYDRHLQKVRQDHLTFTYTPDGDLASMTEAERTTRYSYSPAGRLQSKQLPDGQILSYEYDSLGHLARIGDQSIAYDKLGRLISGSGFHRTLDAFGNILKEEFTNGLSIESKYDAHDRPLERFLPDQSKIVYEYNPLFLERVQHLAPDGTLLYMHTYDFYSDAGDLLLENKRTSYEYDLLGRLTYQSDPILTETYSYDPQGNLIQKGQTTYSYDALSQMTSESNGFTARYDAHYNCIELNNQPISLTHDVNGRLSRDGYVYDVHNRLIAAQNERYIYDAVGRRLTNGSTSYLYLGNEEIAAFDAGQCKELKIPGLNRAAAIEKDSNAYLPIYDGQGTIRYLLDSNLQIAEENHSDAFGRHLNPRIPYAYLGKRLDATGLIYFGQRFYDPNLGRWLTPDPAGPLDSSNLYQYVFNNPICFVDPNGEFVFAIPLFVWGAEIILPTLTSLITPVICGAIAGIVAYEGYRLLQSLDLNPIPWTCATHDTSMPNLNSTILPITTGIFGITVWNEVYAPDRPLPRDKDGVPIPDTDAPHTQLGTRKKQYPQSREFDKDGNPVRDIDFTDHNSPEIHPNPHQHPYNDNPTGGTSQRGPAQPL